MAYQIATVNGVKCVVDSGATTPVSDVTGDGGDVIASSAAILANAAGATWQTSRGWMPRKEAMSPDRSAAPTNHTRPLPCGPNSRPHRRRNMAIHSGPGVHRRRTASG